MLAATHLAPGPEPPLSLLVPAGQVLRVVLTAWTFATFYLGGLMLSWVVLPLAGLRGGDRLARVARAQAIVRGAFRLFHDGMRWGFLLKADPRSTRLGLPAGPCVVVCNHPTLVDVTAVLAAAPTVACVVKGPLFRGLLLGNLLRHCWHVDGGSGTSADNARVLAEAAERLAAGLPVLVFPEGTRSPENGLHPFKRGAFEMAVRARVPVVLLLARCQPPVLAKTAPWYRAPRTVPFHAVEHLNVLHSAEFSGDSKAMAAAAARLYYARIEGVPAPAMAGLATLQPA